MIKRALLLLAVLVLSPPVAEAQPAWRIASSVIVAPQSDGSQLESWLAVDPLDPRHLLAAVMVAGTEGVELFDSRDGGATWERGAGPGERGMFPGQDPVVQFGPDGSAWLMTITSRQPGAWGYREPSRNLNLWRALDGDSSWERLPEVPGGMYDRPYLAVEPGEDGVEVHAIGKISAVVFDAPLFPDRSVLASTRSTDGGRSFRAPRLLMPLPTEEALHAPTGLLITPEGRTVVPFLSFRLPTSTTMPRILEQTLRVTVADAPGRFGGSTLVARVPVFSNAEPLRSLMGLGVGGLAQHVDGAGAGGALHLVWNGLQGETYRVFSASSEDLGGSWSAPVPIAPDGASGDQASPAVAVNRSGTVAVMWNDFRTDPDHACYEVLFATRDRGASAFATPLRISTAPTCAAAPVDRDDPDAARGAWLADGKIDPDSPAYRWVNGGDTQGIVAFPDGSFGLTWSGAVDGVPRLRFTRVVRAD